MKTQGATAACPFARPDWEVPVPDDNAREFGVEPVGSHQPTLQDRRPEQTDVLACMRMAS